MVMKKMNIKNNLSGFRSLLDKLIPTILSDNKNLKFIKTSKKVTGGKYGKTIITNSP